MRKNRLLLLFMAVLCVFGVQLQAKVTHLLPKPQQVTLTGGAGFALGRAVSVTDPTDCAYLTRVLTETGCTIEDGAAATITVTLGTVPGAYDFELDGFPNEAYSLNITSDAIDIVAVTPTGVIRAAQTISQLAQGYDGTAELEALTMKDWPAFKLRGYMHDVGRSFISVAELKKQIDVLAHFKVNTFHWHFTENQAWRLQINAYPQLTSSESMTRFAGKFYTQAECREVQDYAAERGIIIIPEVDMPGHSEAFTRAMGHNMQTAEGVAELKVIIKEVCELFDKATYIHIGGDEVTITWPNFLETMIAEVKSHGKKAMVWNPINGVNVANLDADMTQMWSSRGARIAGKASIDCRYNYTNHFDVFADLVGIFRSNIYYQGKGDAEIPGFLSCPWNDRKTPTEGDIIRQNNFYANVIASTERAWVGGKDGAANYIEKLGTMLPNTGEGYEEFADWERRFLFHKATTMSEVADKIPYVKQANVRWKITDAFPNGGNSATAFPPETEGLKDSYTYNGQTYNVGAATGAGIYLRHTWGNDIIPTYFGSTNHTNATAYAWTYVYSPTEQTVGAQIEFHNYGRSEKDAAPDAGKWDRKGSDIWVNDVRVTPPTWGNSGKSINNEVDLLNENFSARTPVQVTLNQGWNKVFLKLPYVGANGVRLNKWLFTCVFTDIEGKNAVDGLVYSPNKYMDESTEQLSMLISEVRREVNSKIGTDIGLYPASLAADILTKLDEIEQTLSASMSADERAAQMEEINQAKATFYASMATTAPNGPKVSSEDEIFAYTFKDKRGNKYVTSTGSGTGLVGNTSVSDASKWKFELRTDGKYNIVNLKDKSFIAPTVANNSQLPTSATQPTNGWELKQASEGYVIVISGTVQLHQSTGSNVLNWGGGTNSTDGGCLYLIEETEYTEPGEGPETVTYTIDKANGNLYHANGSANQNWNCVWKSDATPQLQFGCGTINNMNWSGNNVQLMTGSAGSATYTLTPPEGYVIEEYSCTFVNNNHTTGLTFTMAGGGETFTTSTTGRTLSATGQSLASLSFTLTGSNGKGLLMQNCTVKIKQGTVEPVGPFIPTTIVDGQFAPDTKWYTMKIGTSGLYISDNGEANHIALTKIHTAGEDADFWCFVGSDETGYKVYNRQTGVSKVLASSSTMGTLSGYGGTGGSTYPTLQDANALPTGTIGLWDFAPSTSLSGVNGFYMKLHGTDYAVNNFASLGKLAFWAEGMDAGSTIVFVQEADETIVDPSTMNVVFPTAGQSVPYRIPAIAQASNGNLIAVADYRYSKADIGSGNLDLRYSISTDNGKTWGDIQTLISHTHNGGGNLHTGYGDPCIVADRESNRVMVLSCSGNVMFTGASRNHHQGIARFYSEDNGETWSTPYDLSDSIYAMFDNCTIGTAKSMFVGSGKISQSKTIKVGEYYRIYCALLFKDNNGTNKNYALYSDNFGDTWSVLGGINVAPIPSGADEPKAEELPDGSVLVSSRVNGGRYFNVFHYTNVETGEGEWTTSTFSGADNNGTASPGYTCNGEILVVPVVRKADNKPMYLLLQSVPFGSGRQNVGIYYKELSSMADINSGAGIAKDWDGNYQVSFTTSCYSTMVQMDNDSIAFLYEENSINSGYDIMYRALSIEQITADAYAPATGDVEVSIGDLIAASIDDEYAALADLVGTTVGNLTEAGYESIRTAYETCKAEPTMDNYKAFQASINSAEAVQLSGAIKYRLRNKQYPTKYLVINSSKMTIATLSESNENQLVTFVSNGDGSWKIYCEAVNGYVRSTGANETEIPVGTNGANYLVVSNVQGESYLQCTTPTGPHPVIHVAGDQTRIVPWNADAGASRWYIEPTDITTGIEIIEADDAQSETFYDLLGRQVENPKNGIYVTSRKRKVLVK